MWRDLLPKPRPWPESLQTSTTNPIQLESTPQDASLALEVAAQSANQKSERRRNWAFIFGLAVFALVVMAALNFLPAANYLAVSYATILVAFGVLLYFLTDFATWPLWLRLPIGAVVAYTLYFYLYFPPRPACLLVVAILLVFGIADTIAAHVFQIRTTELGDASRTRQLRRLWHNRFNPFASQAKGLEYYWLLLPVCAVSAFLGYKNIPDPQMGFPLSNARGFYLAAAVPLVFFLLLGPLTGLLNRRGFLDYGSALKSSIQACFGWLNYNRQQLAAPGVVQSPIRSTTRRKYLVTSVWLVLIAASTSHFHWGLQYARQAMFGDAMAVRLPPTLKWLLPDGHDEWLAKEELRRELEPEGINLDEFIDQGILYSETPGLKQEGLVEVEGILMEPRQVKILERLTGSARESYLQRAREAQEERERQALFAAEEEIWRVADERLKAKTQNWAYIPIMYVWVGVERVSHIATVFFFALVLVLPITLAVVSQPLGTMYLLGLNASSSKETKTLSTQEWNSAVSRMSGSANAVERDSIFLGVNAADRSPILVPRSVFEEHMHLLGDSGSGKTSLGIAPLMAQLIAGGDCSVILLDMKGDDHSLIETARIGAEKAKVPFRWFTNQLGTPTYLFNPLQQRFLENLTLYQRADILAAGLGLQYGTDYGRSFYSDANAALLHAVFEFNPNIGSFVELLEAIESRDALQGLSRDIKKAASHIGTVVKRLADWEPLNATSDGPYPAAALENAIDLSDVFCSPQVIAFHIASTLGTASSAEMGRLALYSLLSGAQAAGTKRTQVFLIIDEFQRIVSTNIELLLQTARSMNIGVILANQTLMDLKTSGVDLIPSVRANTRIKQVFAASDLTEQQETSATSGETIYHSKSWNSYISMLGLSMAGRMIGSKEEISPRLRPNEILAMTDHPQRSILHVRRGKGYAQYAGLPLVMESAFHISSEEYETRRNADWVDRGEETIIPELRIPEVRPDPVTENQSDKKAKNDSRKQSSRPVRKPAAKKAPSEPSPQTPVAEPIEESTTKEPPADLLSGFGESYMLPTPRAKKKKESQDES